MAINQLFKIKPSIELVKQICSYFNVNLDNLEANNSFTINSLNIIYLDEIKKKLNDYYIPCKQKIYLNNITKKKTITILRQLLKLYNFNLNSKEIYENTKKIISYTIVPKKIDSIKKINNGVINFD